MTSTPNPVLPPTALLKPVMPGIYNRAQIYDVTYTDASYAAYAGQRIVPAIGSLVRDIDETPLWVIAIDDVTYVPSYTTVPLSSENDNVVSLLNYGNTVFRLYVDYRALPYPVTPDSKCIFIGKSPRLYTLSRYPGTSHESIISKYYNSTGQLVSQTVPLTALDSNNNSWFLPRSHVSVILDDNEEVGIKIYSEDGTEVYSATMFAKQSAVINEDVVYSPTIVGMTISANQQLANGTFYLYEKQGFESLGFKATLVYDDGTTADVPIDNVKCVLYGQSDFIPSFSGLTQYLTIKYYRSADEAIAPGLSDVTGSMISTTVPVQVINNTLGVTNKIIPIPVYNGSLAQYTMRYWMYFADGRGHTDVSAYVSILSGTLSTDSSHYGVQQTYVISVDMHTVDPAHYPTSALYQQNVVIQFNAPTTLVKWTIRDATTSQYILGQDSVLSRRASLCYDSTRHQYFIPSSVFGNVQAFLNSFYTQSSPPYDPSVSQIPQVPTHFIIRDVLTGLMKVAAPIAIADYAQAFNILNDTIGNYVNAVVMVEFLYKPNSSVTNTLFAIPVNVTTGSYIGS